MILASADIANTRLLTEDDRIPSAVITGPPGIGELCVVLQDYYSK